MSLHGVNQNFAAGVIIPMRNTSKRYCWTGKQLAWGGILLRTVSCCSAKSHDKVAVLEKKTNFYEVLCLSSANVGLEEIKKAYRSIALRYHPDVCSNSCFSKDELTRRFVEVQKAYETLSDPVSRSMHDYELGLIGNRSIGFMGSSIYSTTEWDKGIRRFNFPEQIWERQLSGLRERSKVRMERKR